MKPISIILIVFALTSCETQLQIDVPVEPRRAVINSVFLSDSVWRVSISTSSPIESNLIIHVFDPELILTDETGQRIPLTVETLDPMMYHPSQNPGADYFRGTARPQPGMTYRIELRSTNLPTAFATARTPSIVEVLDAKLDTSALAAPFQPGEYISLPVEFTFDDPAGQGDYYYPLMTETVEYEYRDQVTGDTLTALWTHVFQVVEKVAEDEFLDFGDELNAISDAAFDGQRHSMKMFALYPNFHGVPGKVISRKFCLDHSDAEYFRYFRSMRLQEAARYNPFAEPVQVHSNVEGGMGIFVGRSTSYWEFIK